LDNPVSLLSLSLSPQSEEVVSTASTEEDAEDAINKEEDASRR
jgi:hypothetical protein